MLGLVRAYGGTVGFVYFSALNGFSVQLPAPPLLAALPGVVSVEPDGVARISATPTPTPSSGLHRVDQRALPLNSRFATARTGAGGDGSIIDTGILLSHPDVTGRVSDFDDAVHGNGHGPHVAGTTGGTPTASRRAPP